jgi:hypothetical protein
MLITLVFILGLIMGATIGLFAAALLLTAKGDEECS